MMTKHQIFNANLKLLTAVLIFSLNAITLTAYASDDVPDSLNEKPFKGVTLFGVTIGQPIDLPLCVTENDKGEPIKSKEYCAQFSSDAQKSGVAFYNPGGQLKSISTENTYAYGDCKPLRFLEQSNDAYASIEKHTPILTLYRVDNILPSHAEELFVTTCQTLRAYDKQLKSQLTDEEKATHKSYGLQWHIYEPDENCKLNDPAEYTFMEASFKFNKPINGVGGFSLDISREQVFALDEEVPVMEYRPLCLQLRAFR